MRFLVVDDDYAICKLLELYLDPRGQVDTARSGTEAIRLLLRQAAPGYDLVFLDIMMHDVGGAQVCRAIREMQSMGRNPCGTVVGFVTSYDDEELVKARRDCAPDFVIVKPFTEGQVLAVVNDVASRKPTRPSY